MSDKEEVERIDIPIGRCDQDKLDRVKYAEAIANFIYNSPVVKEHSQIVAIYSPWGEGKSSLKNMICEKHKEACASKSRKDPIIVEFSPWIYSNNDKLPTLFFNAIATEILKHNSFWRLFKENSFWQNLTFQSTGDFFLSHKIARRWRKIGSVLNIIQMPVITAAAGFVSAHYEELATDLDSQKNELRKFLSKNKQPVVVVIDDLDRVSSIEIRNLINLTKANGDFPYVTYILLGDRDYIARALMETVDGQTIQDGHEYLKKIVALEFDLPRLPQDKIRHELSAGLLSITTTLKIKGFTPEADLKSYTIALFSNLRDVKRFINAVHFRLELQKTQEGQTCTFLSVDFSDLLTLEACRLFENKLYTTLYQQKHLLMGYGNAPTPEQMDNIFFKRLSNPESPILIYFAKMLLNDLFGWRYSPGYKDIKPLYEKSRSAVSCFRISARERFENYFLCDPDLTQYNGRDENSFAEVLHSETELLNLFNRLLAEGKIDDFLLGKQANAHRLDNNPRQNLIKALLQFSELAMTTVKQQPYYFGRNPLAKTIGDTIMMVIRDSDDLEQRWSWLVDMICSDDSLIVFPIRLRKTIIETQGLGFSLCVKEVANKLTDVIYTRILRLQKERKLIKHCDEINIRQTWLELSLSSETKKIAMKDALSSDLTKYPNVFHVLLSFSECSEIGYFLQYDSLCERIDPQPVYDVIEDLILKDEYEIQIRNCLKFCIAAKAKGTPYTKDDQHKAVYGKS